MPQNERSPRGAEARGTSRLRFPGGNDTEDSPATSDLQPIVRRAGEHADVASAMRQAAIAEPLAAPWLKRDHARRIRDANALFRLAEAYDARQAERRAEAERQPTDGAAK